jgi:hypothetical protein
MQNIPKTPCRLWKRAKQSVAPLGDRLILLRAGRTMRSACVLGLLSCAVLAGCGHSRAPSVTTHHAAVGRSVCTSLETQLTTISQHAITAYPYARRLFVAALSESATATQAAGNRLRPMSRPTAEQLRATAAGFRDLGHAVAARGVGGMRIAPGEVKQYIALSVEVGRACKRAVLSS